MKKLLSLIAVSLVVTCAAFAAPVIVTRNVIFDAQYRQNFQGSYISYSYSGDTKDVISLVRSNKNMFDGSVVYVSNFITDHETKTTKVQVIYGFNVPAVGGFGPYLYPIDMGKGYFHLIYYGYNASWFGEYKNNPNARYYSISYYGDEKDVAKYVKTIQSKSYPVVYKNKPIHYGTPNSPNNNVVVHIIFVVE